MAGVQGKKKKRKYLFGLPIAVISVLVLVFLARGTWKTYRRDALSRKNLRLAEEQLTTLRDRQNNLKEKIKMLETPRGIEEEIRANFSVVKEGEKVINLVEEATTTAPTTTVEKPWWRIF